MLHRYHIDIVNSDVAILSIFNFIY